MESEEGPGLHHAIGVETMGLDPSPTFVPHVLFNQVKHIFFCIKMNNYFDTNPLNEMMFVKIFNFHHDNDKEILPFDEESANPY